MVVDQDWVDIVSGTPLPAHSACAVNDMHFPLSPAESTLCTQWSSALLHLLNQFLRGNINGTQTGILENGETVQTESDYFPFPSHNQHDVESRRKKIDDNHYFVNKTIIRRIALYLEVKRLAEIIFLGCVSRPYI